MFSLGHITGSNAAVFDPDNGIPSLRGKVILVTGGSAGLGKQSIIYLARHNPTEIWLAAKTRDTAEKACVHIREQIPDAKLEPLQLDLASFQSINQAATEVLARVSRLDILMLNAGVMATLPGVTEDGYENQFGINYMGHALLTTLLLPVLEKTANAEADARIIVVTSYSHWNAPEGGIIFDTLKTAAEQMSPLKLYAQSKLANILFARQFAKEYPRLTISAIHPGAANTALQANVVGIGFAERIINYLMNKLFLHQPVETVAKHQVWAATTDHIQSGEYYEPLGIVGKRRLEAEDEELAERLWKWTEGEFQAWRARQR